MWLARMHLTMHHFNILQAQVAASQTAALVCTA